MHNLYNRLSFAATHTLGLRSPWLTKLTVGSPPCGSLRLSWVHAFDDFEMD